MKEWSEGTFWCTCETCEVMPTPPERMRLLSRAARVGKKRIEGALRTSKSRIY